MPRFSSWVHASGGFPTSTTGLERIGDVPGSERGRPDGGGITFNLAGTGHGSNVTILFPIPVPPVDANGRFRLERVFCLWGCDANTWITNFAVTDGRHHPRWSFRPPIPPGYNVETSYRGADLASDITWTPVSASGRQVTNTWEVSARPEILFGLCLTVAVGGTGQVWFSTCGVDLA